jgi:hypothetical protein
MSFALKCFRNGVPHERDYPGATYQQSMTRALKSPERWDYVETLSGNIRRYRNEDGPPPPAAFGTLAIAVEEAAKLRDRAQARLDLPKPAHKIHTEVAQTISLPEQGSRPMQPHRSPFAARNELRAAIKHVAWFLPKEFRRQHLQQEVKTRLATDYSESNINNFVEECLREGIFKKVRFGWFSVREGFAVPPPEPPTATVPPAPTPIPTLARPSSSNNPLDKLFDKPFPSKQSAPQEQASPPPSNGVHPPTQIAAVAEAPPLNVQNSMLSMMVLADLVATDTTGHEMLLLEIGETMATLQKRLDELATMVAIYVRAQEARKQLLALVGKEQPAKEAAMTNRPAATTTITTTTEKVSAAH